MQWAELTHEYINTIKTTYEQVAQNARANSDRIDGTNNNGRFYDWLFC